MSTVLSNTTFQFIIATVVTILIPIIIYLKSTPTRSLSYKIINIIPLLDFREEVKDKIKITFMGNKVEDVTLSLIQFVNTGKKELTKDDFVEPITLIFDKDNKILTAEISESKPENLGVVLSSKDNVLTIDGIKLINSKEFFTIKIFTTKSFESPLKMEYRIKGIKIKEITPKVTSLRLVIIGFALSVLLIYGGVFGFIFTHDGFFDSLILTGIILFIAFLSIVGFALFSTGYDRVTERKIKKVLSKE
jgi:hypothetical protein